MHVLCACVPGQTRRFFEHSRPLLASRHHLCQLKTTLLGYAASGEKEVHSCKQDTELVAGSIIESCRKERGREEGGVKDRKAKESRWGRKG